MKTSKTFFVILGIHVAIIIVLASYSFIKRWIPSREKPEVVTWASIQPMAETPPMPEPKPAPKKTPEEPPKPVVKKPKPVLKKPSEIKKSKKKVRRVKEKRILKPKTRPQPRPAKPIVSSDQIKKMMGASSSTPPNKQASKTDWSFFYALVREKMYGAWSQPKGLASHLSAEVKIRVGRSGKILQRTLIRPSGNRALDQSVMRAAKNVAYIKALPSSFSEMYKEVTITFELQNER